jgi:hypothetical protein
MKVQDETTPQPSTDRESKATVAINQLLQVWESGDLPRHIERSTIRRQAGSIRACDSWSLGNQLLMLLAGTDDARGFRQWEQIGRRVHKGERGLLHLRPLHPQG